jgi:Cu(I)/Ag(I) efflux system membrane protein CusA/SilA
VEPRDSRPVSALDRLTGFFLETPVVVGVLVLLALGAGLLVAPFDWQLSGLPRDPVPVDAIPDTGENQQIVFTDWPGRSPQDVEDQVTYPLTVALLGVPGVKSVRSTSMFGFSSIFLIFDDGVEFYWSRSRLLEKLSSLPAGALPEGVRPTLGPDATPLGQVFWYTLEGRDAEGRPAGGWDLGELRSIQDWQVRYALASVEGVAEVASIGGHVQEYQVDVDPDAMRAHGVTLEQVFRAVAASNVDVGARTIELNRAEYVIRGLGLLEGVEDLEQTVVGVSNNVPITIREIARVGLGPALRRGALDKGGAEAVGGVVVARHGANPMEVLQAVRRRLEELAPGLPTKTLEDGRTSRVTVVPFYDRSGLIQETLGTLEHALVLEILVTVLVVLWMLGHTRGALLVSALLPLSVLLTFVAMKAFGVDANVVALSGIAIAIGTVVDVGIVLVESILGHLEPGQDRSERLEAVRRGTTEVGGAVMTAVVTTVLGFLPVFAMEGAEGKLFRPLAFTKTFALVASIVAGLVVLPALARLVLGSATSRRAGTVWAGRLVRPVLVALTLVLLSRIWEPLGPERELAGLLFTVLFFGGALLAFRAVVAVYEPVLRWCLANKLLFLSAPTGLVLVGLCAWLGYPRVAGALVPGAGTEGRADAWLGELFPGLGEEFMPPLDEGSFLLMPVTMSHASIGEALELMQLQDLRLRAIPEVDQVVGKIGRVESALDPAPVSMVETIITYLPEYRTGPDGERLRFAHDASTGEFVRDGDGELVPDEDGRPFRQWRDEVREPMDIWRLIEEAAAVPGMTTASMIQPIETRRIMLQTGLRAPMGVKVFGPDLDALEEAALAIEAALKEVPEVRAGTVLADRVVGKPYLEIDVDRRAIARYGLSVRAVQDVIEVAVGGRRVTTTVEGRERRPVLVRYPRERRDRVEELEQILVPAPGGVQVPLGQLAEVRYTPGPQSIRSEDTFLTAHVLFDRRPEVAEVDAVEAASAHLARRIEEGALQLPAGVSYRFAGEYENQQRAEARLRILLPLALLLIFLVLYLQFRSVATTALVFTAVFVAWSGGFVLLWLGSLPGFLDLELAGVDLRELFQLEPRNLSVAVWVGFLALFGIATDDGVLMATRIRQLVDERRPTDAAGVREAVVEAGRRRIRPCLMTTATTVLALIPVLTSTGRGSDVMVPMAIPSVGGMLVAIVTILVVPVLQDFLETRRLHRHLPVEGSAGTVPDSPDRT